MGEPLITPQKTRSTPNVKTSPNFPRSATRRAPSRPERCAPVAGPRGFRVEPGTERRRRAQATRIAESKPDGTACSQAGCQMHRRKSTDTGCSASSPRLPPAGAVERQSPARPAGSNGVRVMCAGAPGRRSCSFALHESLRERLRQVLREPGTTTRLWFRSLLRPASGGGPRLSFEGARSPFGARGGSSRP